MHICRIYAGPGLLVYCGNTRWRAPDLPKLFLAPSSVELNSREYLLNKSSYGAVNSNKKSANTIFKWAEVTIARSERKQKQGEQFAKTQLPKTFFSLISENCDLFAFRVVNSFHWNGIRCRQPTPLTSTHTNTRSLCNRKIKITNSSKKIVHK